MKNRERFVSVPAARSCIEANVGDPILKACMNNVLDGMPAADAAPVVHGRWDKHKTMHGFVYCSACRDVYLDAEWLADGKWTYCPNCGAKMDLEVAHDPI
jgi:hypothetical protein